ncbi:MAG: hypothetical protein QW701_03485 [Candidatus Nezhaarchaeales archaeon]
MTFELYSADVLSQRDGKFIVNVRCANSKSRAYDFPTPILVFNGVEYVDRINREASIGDSTCTTIVFSFATPKEKTSMSYHDGSSAMKRTLNINCRTTLNLNDAFLVSM